MYQKSIKSLSNNLKLSYFGGYILCRIPAGLNDAFNQLWICTQYAISHNRAIIFEMLYYSYTDLTTIFDFSMYPVPVFFKQKMEELKHLTTEPSDYDYNSPHIKLLTFNKNKSYPSNILLIHQEFGGGNQSINVFRYLRLTNKCADLIKNTLKLLPPTYSAIHIRNTDMKVDNMDIMIQSIK